LGLGAAALPAAALFFGPAQAGWLAGGTYLLRQLLRRWLLRDPLRRQGHLRLLPTVADGSRVTLAALAGTLIWRLGSTLPQPGVADLPRAVAASGGYLLVLIGLRLLDRRQPQEPGERSLRGLAAAVALDGFGWFWGLLVAQILLVLGWPTGLLLLAAVSLLSAETARNVHLRRIAVERVAELWEVTRAGDRIVHRSPELTGLAEQVLAECRNVLPFSWFQFKLPDSREGSRIWAAGPGGEIKEGAAEPPLTPSMLPGIHRRSSWKILDRELRGDGEVIARLRFWCDPRQLEPTAIELFDSLLPQLASSVHRVLLDRQAKRDALTGLADRRVLESHLEKVFNQTRRDGGSMAVIMCDLDRFKKVNDRHGHEAGDRALVLVAEVLETHRRDTDLSCRYGGEEFAVILEKTDGETAQGVAERLRMELQRSDFLVDGKRIPLRMSAGVAAYPEIYIKRARELVLLADEALYKAKHCGRNRSLLHLGQGRFRTADGRVVEAEEPPPPPQAPTLFA
jgi:diguanylate cyclase (GGDEF)-like protein